MLKTNSKKARENIRKYIVDHFDGENYIDTPPETWETIAPFILETFRAEKYHLPEDVRYYRGSEYAAFADWCAGLPSLLDTCYYYNRSAVADLAAILDETPDQAGRYSEQEAETRLTYVLYRELTGAEK